MLRKGKRLAEELKSHSSRSPDREIKAYEVD